LVFLEKNDKNQGKLQKNLPIPKKNSIFIPDMAKHPHTLSQILDLASKSAMLHKNTYIYNITPPPI